MKVVKNRRILLLTILSLGIVAFPFVSAHANISFEKEGEVDVGLGPPLGTDPYVDMIMYLESVESVLEVGNYANRSRLFVDKAGTDNTYGPVAFASMDGGTSNHGDYWLRPVATTHILNGEVFPEDGQLEVGTFTFTFDRPLDRLDITYFDVETSGTTGITHIDGQALSTVDWVPKGPDKGLFYQTFRDLSSFTIKLGKYNSSTGDGANFVVSARAAPEPSVTVLLLLALAVLFLRVKKLLTYNDSHMEV